MKKPSKTEAIKMAQREVTPLYKFGNAWAFNVWDKHFGAWRSHQMGCYWAAKHARTTTMIKLAVLLRTGSEEEALLTSANYHDGSWTAHVI
jgi:hypothetical protein